MNDVGFLVIIFRTADNNDSMVECLQNVLKDENYKNLTVSKASCKANNRKGERVAKPPFSHSASAVTFSLFALQLA